MKHSMNPLPSPEHLRELLDYNPETGALTWLERPAHLFQNTARRTAEHNAAVWNSKFAGAEAMTARNSDGYRHGTVWGLKLKAHRVAWAIYYGQWPVGEIDHVNQDKADNRILNLRDVSHHQNMLNVPRKRSNTSGVTGVYWERRISKWRVSICVDRQRTYVGVFSRFEDAVKARREAEAKAGYHQNHGAHQHNQISDEQLARFEREAARVSA